MSKRILINREECEVRVAFLEDNKLTELHTERIDEQTVVNNVYRGRVQDVVPGLQAAFIDVGLERNLFLHFMDVRSEALVLNADNQKEMLREAARTPIPGRIQRPGRRPRQDPKAPQGAAPVKKGQDLIIQVVKDEIGGKAPRASTNLSLAGRYLVMLPFPSQEGGVSRKIAQGQDRFRLKKLLSELKTKDHSFIVRTAGLDQGEEALRRDAETLEELWETILTKYRQLKGPGLIHNDRSLISRMVRDAFPPDFEEVVCDDAADAAALRIELADLMPGREERVSVHDGVESLFDRFGVEKQIEASLAEKIFLPSGGSIVIDENEALTAIDVNTGRFTGRRDQEKTSLKTNMEACVEIARQLRVRDLGGIIVCDFIDMLSRGHQEQLQEEMRRQLTSDRSRTTIGRASDFGLMILTRKRHRMSLQKQTYDSCPYCNGSGFVRNTDQIQRRMKYDIRRILKEHAGLRTLVVSAHPQFIEALNNRYRAYVERLRTDAHLELVYRPLAEMHLEDYQLTPIDLANTEGLQLPAARVPVDATIAIPKSYTEPAAKAAAHYEEEDDDAEDGEDGLEAATESDAASDGQDGERSGRKRRRRRESSAERRARRKARKDNGEDGASSAVTDGDEAEETAAASEHEAEAPASEEAVASPMPSEAAGDGDDEAGEEQPKRRTRRGSRGGRGRRRKDREAASEDVAADGAGLAAEPAPSDEPREAPKEEEKPAPKKPLPPLKVPALAVKKSSSLLLGFLDEIERAVGSMKGSPAEEEPVEEPAVAEAPAAALEPAPQVEEKEPEAAATPAAEPAEEKKPASRRTTRSRSTATSRAKKKAPEEEAKAKPEAAADGKETKEPARKATTTRRKAATTSKTKEAGAESASPAKASTRRTTTSKADGAEKPRKAAASKAKSATSTAKSKAASTAKKAPTTTRRKKTTKEASE